MSHARRPRRPARMAGLLFLSAFLLDSGAQEVVVRASASEEAPAPVVVVGSAEPVAYLGVQLEEETENPDGGARVTQVVESSPAAEAGIREDDIVVRFDGTRIHGPAGLTKQIHAKSPGDTVKIVVLRDGREQRIEVELADRAERSVRRSWTVAPLPELHPVVPELDEGVRRKLERSLRHLELPRIYGLGSCEGEDCGTLRLLWGGRPRLGVELVETTPELGRHLGSADGSGVLVSKVLRGMPAEHAGIRVGDLIVRVGEDPIENVSDLRRALSDREGETFEIQLVRDKKPVRVEVTLPQGTDEEVTGPLARTAPAPPAAPLPPRAPRPAAAPEPPGVPPAPPEPPAPPAPPDRVRRDPGVRSGTV